MHSLAVARVFDTVICKQVVSTRFPFIFKGISMTIIMEGAGLAKKFLEPGPSNSCPYQYLGGSIAPVSPGARKASVRPCLKLS